MPPQPASISTSKSVKINQAHLRQCNIGAHIHQSPQVGLGIRMAGVPATNRGASFAPWNREWESPIRRCATALTCVTGKPCHMFVP